VPPLPLLYFRRRVLEGRDNMGGGAGAPPRHPEARRQVGRIAPKFTRLTQAIDRQRAEMAAAPAGIDPEYVLVLETRGTPSAFLTAVRNTDGFEWLGDISLEDLDPDLDFFDEGDPEKKLKGRLFLSMANRQATLELISLFNTYIENPAADLGYGKAGWKGIFALLHDVRQWNETDRLEESGLFEDWRYRIENDQELLPVEIELWFRNADIQRALAQEYISQSVQDLGGSIVKNCIIPDAGYHSILAEIPAPAAERLINNEETRLLKAHQVMLFRPVGQCASVTPAEFVTSPAEHDFTGHLPNLNSAEAVVALFDGAPMANHEAIQQRVIVDDPDDFTSDYQAGEFRHGTAMASLLLHDELDAQDAPLRTPLYIRPIMKPDETDFNAPRREHIPQNELPADLIHRAVIRMLEGDGDEPPAAPNVKVINISIGDHTRPYLRYFSPLARVLDYLSWKYKVLFCVSSGNCYEDIHVDPVPTVDEDRAAAALQNINQDLRHRRILSPSESINSLSIGAAHSDHSGGVLNHRQIELAHEPSLPSPISTKGLGFKQAIKPDFLYRGGRQIHILPIQNGRPCGIVTSSNPPGQRVATPPATPGATNETCHICGTSNATALTSRNASFCYEVLRHMQEEHDDFDINPRCIAPMIKAMLAHTATWGEASDFIRQELGQELDERKVKPLIYKHLGYGVPVFENVLTCTDKRVTVLATGQIRRDEGHEYTFPLPPSLSGQTVERVLSITLAWLTPTIHSNRDYRRASLFFSPPKDELQVERFDTDWQAVRRGTLQHERLGGERAAAFMDGEGARIKVSCRQDAGPFDEPIPYGLVVTLEALGDIELPLYTEIRDRLQVAVPVQPQA